MIDELSSILGEWSAVEMALAMAAIFVAAILRAFTGFGFALMAVPVLGLMFEPLLVIPIVLMLEVVTGAQLVPGAWAPTDKTLFRRLSIAAVILMPVGVLVLTQLTGDQMRLVLAGVVILSISLFAYSARAGEKGGLKATPMGAYIAGGFSGMLTGAAGVPGPPVLGYMLGAKLDPNVQRATLLTYFLLIDVATLIALLIAGAPALDSVLRAILFLPVLIIGNVVGARAFKRFSADAYRPVTLVLLLFIAGALVVKVVQG